MFYYYGRKKRIAHLYPAPNYDTIIEPFAGAAAYSCYGANWQRRIILVDKDAKVVDIWKWLIEEMTAEQIINLPDLRVGEKSSEFLHIVHASTKCAFTYNTITITPILQSNWQASKRYMASSIHKIKHWEIVHGDYTDSPDIEATWFIDPPYKGDAGLGYGYNSKNMDYQQLADWIQERKGEVICCEGEYGDYLPFVRLTDMNGVGGKLNTELLHYKSPFPRQVQLSFDDILQR